MSSMTAEKAYEEIARLGRDHALIHQAAGGTIQIVHPETQRNAGIFDRCQRMSGVLSGELNKKKKNACICCGAIRVFKEDDDGVHGTLCGG